MIMSYISITVIRTITRLATCALLLSKQFYHLPSNNPVPIGYIVISVYTRIFHRVSTTAGCAVSADQSSSPVVS